MPYLAWMGDICSRSTVGCATPVCKIISLTGYIVTLIWGGNECAPVFQIRVWHLLAGFPLASVERVLNDRRYTNRESLLKLQFPYKTISCVITGTLNRVQGKKIAVANKLMKNFKTTAIITAWTSHFIFLCAWGDCYHRQIQSSGKS